MNFFRKIKTEGISLRFVYRAMLVLAVIVSGFLLYATYRSSVTFSHLSDATDDYILLQKAVYQLVSASDTLTENAQRFTVAGDRKFLDAYFTEVFETQRREESIDIMTRKLNSTDVLKELQNAMSESLKLMEREYYSMKLVIEAKGYQDYPKVFENIELTPADQALSPKEKMNLAQAMLLDEDYYHQKEIIRGNMQDSLDHLELLTHGTQDKTESDLKSQLQIVRILIMLQTAGIMIMIWLTARLGINPVLQAADNIHKDKPIPVAGAIEFRSLANNYNRMYEVYKNSIAHLNYKASHDELTKAYNRAGYDFIVSTLDLETTYIILFDADNFKEINDSYGHKMGDMVLQRIAETIRHHFRSDDYICRIGGDEFVVFMVHMEEEQKQLIRLKIEQINEELGTIKNGIPPITLSAGVIHGKNITDRNNLLHEADLMMYETKKRGRNGFTFYEKQ